MWHYKLANSDCIQREIADFDWEKAFKRKTMLFNKTIFNIIRNFIPDEIVTFD